MPFAAVGIGAFIVEAVAGAAFVATWSGVAIATAINFGVAIGISMLSSKLFGVDPSQENGSIARSTQLSLQIGSSIPRQLAVGLCATAGSLVYWQLSGDENSILDLVYSLADWPCHSLEYIFIDGVRRGLLLQSDGTYLVNNYELKPLYNTTTKTYTYVSNGHEVDRKYGEKLKVSFHDGSFTQIADAGLIARSGDNLDINFKGIGCCYAIVTLQNDTYNAETQDDIDASVFPNGIPKFMFEIKGAKLYDFRKDSTILGGNGTHRWNDINTWEWTDNPVIIHYNWRRGLWYNNVKLYGLTNSFDSIDLLTYIDAANSCDELISSEDYLHGNTENNILTKKYTANGVSLLNTDKSSLLKDLSMCMHSEEVEVGGLFKLYAGVPKSISATLTKEDTLIDTTYKYVSRKPSNELVNSVFGEYHSSEENYQVISLPNRVDPNDLIIDGMRHEVKYRYGLVTNPEQAQRLMEISRRKERYQGVVTCIFNSAAAMLEPGDWITYSDESKGWLNKIFVIISMPESSPIEIAVTMREINPDVYLWEKENFISLSKIGKVRYLSPTLQTVAGLSLTTIILTSENTSNQRPALRVTWTPINDVTVSKIIFEYRIKGTTDKILTLETSLPSSGSFTIVNGIISNSLYEIRALIKTVPVRQVSWTTWVSSSTNSGTVVVPQGSVEVVIPDNSITEIQLSAQERYLLNLSSQVANGLGEAFDIQSEHGIFALLEDYKGWEKHVIKVEENIVETNNTKASIKVEQDIRVSEIAALSTQVTTIEATVNNSATLITQEATARTLADTQLGTLISTVETQTGELSSAVSVAQTSINGIESKYAITVSQNGVITGSVQLNNTNASSEFKVAVDNFIIANLDGTNATSVFRLDTTTNPPRMVFNGDFFTTGQISADKLNINELSAITGNIGTFTSGLIRNASGTSYWDLDNNIFVLGT